MDFVTAVQNLGIAAACLLALGYAVWAAVRWTLSNIAKPVADRHIKFLDELSFAMNSQSQALQTMAIQQGKNFEGIDRVMIRMEEIIEKQDMLYKTMSDVHSKIGHMEVHTDSVVVQQNKGDDKKGV